MKPLFCLFFLVLFSAEITAQATSSVDFKHLDAQVSIQPQLKKIAGNLTYTFDILKPTDSIFIDARKMEFLEVFLNKKEVDYGSDGQKLWITGDFKPSKNQELGIKYTALPERAMYFIQTGPEDEQDFQVWTQGQGRYTSHWLPSFDDTTEKLEFDLNILYPAGKTVIANGELVASRAINDSVTSWRFNMEKPMSSYLVAMAVGDFEKKSSTSKNGILLENYFPSGKEDFVEPTYRYTEEMMDFFEKEIGVDYPWQNYKQVPVQDFLFSGMENTGTTIFSDLLLIDSIGFHDRNYVNVNAHELAHQWFGNFVTAQSGEHHWLQEGFATYYALLAEKEIFGDDYFYKKLFDSAEELKEMSDSGKGEALLASGGSSLTYYQKGAWALHILKGIIGKEAFDLGIKNYLEKYKFGSVTTDDFIAEMEAASGQDLSQFVTNWLKQSAFQGTEALKSLKQSPFIMDYLEIAALKAYPISEKKQLLKNSLNFPVNDYIGQEVVYQLALEEPSEVLDIYKKAFETNNLYTRQAIAVSLQDIPEELKPKYEKLLEDASYVTQEAALYNLWMNFPEDRMKYLQKMEGKNGFLDGNIRTLWLALSLATAEVSAERKKRFFEELSSYTEPHQRFQLRQNAFGYLYQLGAFNEETLYNLIEAGNHHTYRFRDFARQLLETLIENGNVAPEEVEALKEKFSARNG